MQNYLTRNETLSDEERQLIKQIEEKTVKTQNVQINPLASISNVDADIKKMYPNAENIVGSLKTTQHQNSEVNTVIIGAGPVGLLNAIGLLTKNPDSKVVLLEKYDVYKRNHTLRMEYKQIEKYLKACGEPPDPAIQELVNRVKKSKVIRISEIERLLKNRAIKLGAEIKTDSAVADVQDEVLKEYPNTDLILGADGTRSVVSQQIMGDYKAIQCS